MRGYYRVACGETYVAREHEDLSLSLPEGRRKYVFEKVRSLLDLVWRIPKMLLQVTRRLFLAVYK